jgi:hypothetical protein
VQIDGSINIDLPPRGRSRSFHFNNPAVMRSNDATFDEVALGAIFLLVAKELGAVFGAIHANRPIGMHDGASFGFGLIQQRQKRVVVVVVVVIVSKQKEACRG